MMTKNQIINKYAVLLRVAMKKYHTEIKMLRAKMSKEKERIEQEYDKKSNLYHNKMVEALEGRKK